MFVVVVVFVFLLGVWVCVVVVLVLSCLIFGGNGLYWVVYVSGFLGSGFGIVMLGVFYFLFF